MISGGNLTEQHNEVKCVSQRAEGPTFLFITFLIVAWRYDL